MPIMLAKGMVIQGIWYGNRYRIHKELGRGAIGIVYLVENLQTLQLCAMKISQSMQMAAAEYTRLKAIQKEVQSRHFGPLLYEMDDIRVGRQKFHYFTMEFIAGQTFEQVLGMSTRKRRLQKRQLQYISQVLTYLQELHQRNFIFADVKAENIIIELSGERVRFIDFGGVVPAGKMVKQYSVLYDRGSWKMGGRKADCQYDLFAVSILLIQIFVHRDILVKAQKSANPMYALYDIIHRELPLPLRSVCIKAISEKHRTAGQMFQELQSTGLNIGKRFLSVSKIDCAFWGSLLFMLSTVFYVALKIR